MFEKLTRPLIATGLLLGLSVLFLALPFFRFRMGLDLQGGTRLVYSFDIEQARREQVIEADEDIGELLQQQVDIIRSRVDPTGVLEPIIHTEGTSRVVIEFPGNIGSDAVVAGLGAPLAANARELALDEGSVSLRDFPDVDGVVQVGQERIKYGVRDGRVLSDLQRGHEGTAPADHALGEPVRLTSGDPIRTRIENLGELHFYIVASQGDSQFNLVDETEKLRTWLTANPGKKIHEYNTVPPEENGPPAMLRFYPQRPKDVGADGYDQTDPNNAAACIVEHEDHEEDWDFSGAALGKVYFTQDDFAKPAVGFEMKGERRGDFGDFTGNFVDRLMAIVLNGEVVSSPNLESRLYGAAIIKGDFEVEEVRDLITVLRTGSLKLKPNLESESRVGPTLGSAYVKRGFLGGAVALVAVLAYMTWYYRRLGVYSAIALLCSVLMLLGGLAFFQATVTLPGIAGIVLTLGMAVDGNILIFDRIREERDKGRNVKQAVKSGFENATSAILDSNITTFLTALILYNVGTGPVRGFAVTLMVGILTSVFAALVITRLLIHYALVRGVKEFPMGAWLATANYKFIDKAKIAMTASALAMVASIAGFALTANETKLGIEFLGGRTAMIRTETPTTVEAIEDLLAGVEKDVDREISVKSILDSNGTGFRLSYKEGGAEGAGDASADTGFRDKLEQALKGVLRKGPMDVSVADGAATVRLYFEEAHSVADIESVLEKAGMSELSVALPVEGGGAGTIDASGRVESRITGIDLKKTIEDAFRTAKVDSNSVAYVLTDPIPELSTIGRQVVGELRDKAILSILVSLFAIVLYIRVRFAEYSYGFAAVVALLHDVIVTLGVMTLAMHFTGLAVEMSLPMIAAFLTIIGYSLNDTIIIFDRVRENLPKHRGTLKDLIDLSINQTLSRTIMTSGTTMMAVLVIFGFNVGSGNVLEGFSLAMICGIVVGTYSTIYIASPIYLWLETRTLAAREREQADERSVARGGVKRPEVVA